MIAIKYCSVEKKTRIQSVRDNHALIFIMTQFFCSFFDYSKLQYV